MVAQLFYISFISVIFVSLILSVGLVCFYRTYCYGQTALLNTFRLSSGAETLSSSSRLQGLCVFFDRGDFPSTTDNVLVMLC